jgi:hypothetical protein
VFPDGGDRRFSRRPDLPIDEFFLQSREKTLGDGIDVKTRR